VNMISRLRKDQPVTQQASASIPAYQETARKRVYHELARDRKAPIAPEWLEQLCAHVEEGHPIGEAAAKDLICELIRLQFDLACRDGGLGLLYAIRDALGFNKLYPLSYLDSDAKQQRAALLACAPIVFAAIGNSDLDDEQPVALTIRTTLGVVREARRALFVANLHPTEAAT